MRAGVLLFVTVLGLPPAARAQTPESAVLVYERPERDECPDEQGFRDIVAGRLGSEPFRAEAPITIRAALTAEAHGFAGELRILDGEGREVGARRIPEDADCREVARSLAIAIAIVFDPLGLGSSRPTPEPTRDSPPPDSPDSSAPGSPVPPPSAAAEPDPTPVPPPSEPSPPPELFVLVRVASALGLTPGFAFGPAVGVGTRYDVLSAYLEFRGHFTPTSLSLVDEPVDTMLVTGGPTACIAVEPAFFCAGVQIGAILARAPRVAEPRFVTEVFSYGALRGGVEVPLGASPVVFRVGIELDVPFVHSTIVVDGRDVWTTFPIAGEFSVGLAAHFS